MFGLYFEPTLHMVDSLSPVLPVSLTKQLLTVSVLSLSLLSELAHQEQAVAYFPFPSRRIFPELL